MNILIACEESQAVAIAFRKRGHNAYSCDVQDCSGGHPEWHIKDDVLNHLDAGWDMMIAFPHCTYLAVTGNKWFNPEYKDRFPDRHIQREEAVLFFMKLANATINRIAIENPVSIMSTRWRPADQVIQPWYFGDKHPKKTCLWLKNLPKLRYGKSVQMAFGEDVPPQTDIVDPEYVVYRSRTHKNEFSKYPIAWSGRIKETKMPLAWKMGPSHERTRLRSRTFPGIAEAMAEQWGNIKEALG